MKIEEIMTKSPATCSPSDSLNEPARLMWEHDCGCIPVVEGNGESHPCGIITDRDICMAAYHQGKTLGEIRVRDVMAKTLCTCSPQDGVADVERRMREAQVRRVPVVEQGRLVGIVSLADIALTAEHTPNSRRRGLTEKDVGDTLAGIVRPHTQFTQTPVE